MKGIARSILVASTLGLGLLFAFGSLLAARFERDGFTSAARDGMRPGYIALLVLALAACIAVPAVTSMWAYPALRRPLVAVPVLGVVSVVASLLFIVAIR